MPPVTGLHLAAIIPPDHTVRVVHQQVESLPVVGEADLVAIRFSVASHQRRIGRRSTTGRTVNPGFRVRPVAEVLRDMAYDEFPSWWQRKAVWFWDDNHPARRAYI